jgi:hemoglobin
MRSLYDEIGGDEGVRRLVEAFYDIVETDPEGEPVRRLHLGRFGMNHVRQAQFEFLCGFLGGPKYYVQRMGSSNLRAMHEHLSFGSAEGRAWLACMDRAIDAGVPPPVRAPLMRAFRISAEFLVKERLGRAQAAEAQAAPG